MVSLLRLKCQKAAQGDVCGPRITRSVEIIAKAVRWPPAIMLVPPHERNFDGGAEPQGIELKYRAVVVGMNMYGQV